MKSRGILALSLCLVLVLGLSFAMAAGEKNQVSKKTYGSCVSAQSKIRSSCYQTDKVNYKGCNANVREQYKNRTITNKTQIKNMNAGCRNAYKEAMIQCKLGFKVSKENCAKPNNSSQEGPEEQERERITLNSTICNGNGGIWNECGNKCTINSQGQQNVSCITLCEELCECGTGSNLTCPAKYKCKVPKDFPNALGYCE